MKIVYPLIKRVIDFLLALSLLIVFLPVYLFGFLFLIVYRRSKLKYDLIYSYQGGTFSLLNVFEENTKQPWFARLADFSIISFSRLLNIVTGNMSLVGPEAVAQTEPEPLYVSLRLKPGITGLYQLRRQANIAHETREQADQEYYSTRGLTVDLGILLRAFLMFFLGKNQSSSVNTPEKINMLDIEMDNLSMTQAVDWIVENSWPGAAHHVAFVNPDCFNIAYRNPDYKRTLQTTSKVFADGIGIHYASKMLHVSLRDNVNGTDMFPFLCQAASKNNLSLYFLGSRAEVVSKMVADVKLKYPGLKIAGFHHGYFPEQDSEAVIQQIKNAGTNILLVAFGAPHQELWIKKHLVDLNVGVAIGVGGLFDFVSGRIPRAPRWIREIGLEWVYRLIQEPKRMWRRYIIGNPLFLWRIWHWYRSSRQ